ncbi:MAG: sensor histidine kinase [Deltaproteobacteria bacterium]|nr:sensor histidine kinase [Deltaproteobacteria bacterium]
MGKVNNLFADRQKFFRLALLLVLVAIVTALHYLTATSHSSVHGIYRRLYYLPIVLGGIWFCLRGGVGVSLLVSLLYTPHVLLQWSHLPSVNIEQYLEILLYNTIGFLTGFLSEKERAQRLRVEENARHLAGSYAKLKSQADLILEIEDQLRRADRLTALGELSAGMAHEIRNPLGAIRGTAEILRDAFPPEDRYAEFTQILVSEVDRLNQVLEGFLRFARPDMSDRSDFKPDQILREVLQLTQQQAHKARVSIIWDEQPLPAAIGDSSQFKQVFLNLILNALQALPVGGQVWIETQVEGNKILLKFADNGPGIPDADLDKVFDPFFTTREDGTGLGLAITHRIVKNHCGQISVKNRPEGGAEFTLTLQRVDYPCAEEVADDKTDTAD